MSLVIDVLSFTTTLSVALDVGTEVLPHGLDDATAADYAQWITDHHRPATSSVAGSN